MLSSRLLAFATNSYPMLGCALLHFTMSSLVPQGHAQCRGGASNDMDVRPSGHETQTCPRTSQPANSRIGTVEWRISDMVICDDALILHLWIVNYLEEPIRERISALTLKMRGIRFLAQDGSVWEVPRFPYEPEVETPTEKNTILVSPCGFRKVEVVMYLGEPPLREAAQAPDGRMHIRPSRLNCNLKSFYSEYRAEVSASRLKVTLLITGDFTVHWVRGSPFTNLKTRAIDSPARICNSWDLRQSRFQRNRWTFQVKPQWRLKNSWKRSTRGCRP